MPRDVTWRREAPRSGKPIKWRVLVLSGLLAVNLVVILYHGDPREQMPALAAGPAVPTAAPAAAAPLGSTFDAYDPTVGLRSPGPVRRVEVIHLRARQTPAGALVAAGVATEDAEGALISMAPLVDFRRMRPNDRFKARFDEEDRLLSLDVLRGLVDRARTERGDAGWRAHRLEVPVDSVTTAVSGAIQSSLWATLVEQGGEDPRLVHELVEIFAWSIDFYSEVFPGDTFRLLVEKRYVGGEFLEYGPIHAAEFVTNGTRHQAFMHESSPGVAAYYDAKGQSLRKQLLKAPLKYGRVVSKYGRRMHPILGYTRNHNGIDYGVPAGTEIWAVGDGRVMRAGWNGGYGKFIQIRHPNGWISQYAHLSKIGVKAGQSVVQKQPIGRVGNTGLSTGPHLHYELKYHGKFVNPLTQRFERGKPLSGEALQAFLSRVDALTRKLDEIRMARQSAAASGG